MSENRFAPLLGEENRVQPSNQRRPEKHRNRMESKKSKVKPRPEKPKVVIPAAIQEQLQLRQKFHYGYRTIKNGNVENNTTIYAKTGVAHPHQIKELFHDVIEHAKKMPEIFGLNFDCDVQVNLVQKFTGQYMGYTFVDLSNPKLYFALLGCNVDGSERAEYYDDPDWVPPPEVPAPVPVPKDRDVQKSWAEQVDSDSEENTPRKPSPPKIRRELKPLIKLKEYPYDEKQKLHLQTSETHGSITLSPAFITPGVKPEYDGCKLYVSEIPADDLDFLYTLFARYSRYDTLTPANIARYGNEQYSPRITIHTSGDKKLFAIVQYHHPYDAAFALLMLQKIRASYCNLDVSIPVRYAFNK